MLAQLSREAWAAARETLGDLRSAWAGASAAARHAPRPVRLHRSCSLAAAVFATLVLALVVASAASPGDNAAVVLGWLTAVAMGNIAFLAMMAIPPRSTRAYRGAWRTALGWVAGTFLLVPLGLVVQRFVGNLSAGLIFLSVPIHVALAITIFTRISDEKCAAWYRDPAPPPEDSSPRRPAHPFGYARPQPRPPDEPPPPRAA